MIKVVVSKKDDIINKIEIKGHAKYDESGKDIVCAAVSATVITTVNAIGSISNKVIECISERDKLSIIINKHDKITDKLINNMLSMLTEIEIDYKKYIKIIEEV
jgi:uncharacterized protein YsxB (DUF464 family)